MSSVRNDPAAFLRRLVPLCGCLAALGCSGEAPFAGVRGGRFWWPASSPVPTNIVLLAEVTVDPVSASLTDTDDPTRPVLDASVATVSTPTGDWAWITPASELATRTAYEADLVLEDDTGPGSAPVTWFTTGDGPDLDSPSGGALLAADAHGNGLYVTLDEVSDPASYVELEVAADARFGDRLSMPLLATDPTTPERIELVDLRLPAAGWVRHGDTLFVRSRAIDWAGNAGEWSDATSVQVGSCATVPGGDTVFGLVAALLVSRRRRAGLVLPPGRRAR